MSTNYRDQKKKCQGYFCIPLPQAPFISVPSIFKGAIAPQVTESLILQRPLLHYESTSKNAAARTPHLIRFPI